DRGGIPVSGVRCRRRRWVLPGAVPRPAGAGPPAAPALGPVPRAERRLLPPAAPVHGDDDGARRSVGDGRCLPRRRAPRAGAGPDRPGAPQPGHERGGPPLPRPTSASARALRDHRGRLGRRDLPRRGVRSSDAVLGGVHRPRAGTGAPGGPRPLGTAL
ncbi:MAG: hypothetical protein AVDCRST_MAG35-3151, partial [uncultured Quadrisphaera sp.]